MQSGGMGREKTAAVSHETAADDGLEFLLDESLRQKFFKFSPPPFSREA